MDPKFIIIKVVTFLLAITLHELGHAWTADKLGDPTARMAGRLTLNPIKHLDFLGTLVFFSSMLFTGFAIGWAKPVLVNPFNLKRPRQDMAVVALAGPAANILIAIICSFIYRYMRGLVFTPDQTFLLAILTPLFYLVEYSIMINIMLAVFNLVPVPPLDGSKILAGILSREQANLYSRIEPYGFIILIVLLGTGIINRVVYPVISTLYRLLM